jgi:HK97 family phage prohead protease
VSVNGVVTEERRTNAFAFELRDVDEKSGVLKTLAGRAVPYDTDTDIGWFIERMQYGVFKKSITEAARSLPLLLFHNDAALPVGVVREWSEKRDGLDGVWNIDSRPEAQEAARLAKPDDQGRSMLGYLSVRFLPIQSQWTYATAPGEPDRVLRTEARLVETSLVSTPAYTGSKVEWVRSMDPALRQEASGRRIRGWEEYLAKVKSGPLPG